MYGASLPEDDDASVIQSTRVKLAALRAKDKVNNDIFKEADHDLEQILELEVLNKPSPSPISREIKEPVIIITPKLNYAGGGESVKEKLFQSIKDTFAEIFQVMIVMLESKALFPQLPNEAEKVSKRSKEFEVRFNRSVFETKQQVIKKSTFFLLAISVNYRGAASKSERFFLNCCNFCYTNTTETCNTALKREFCGFYEDIFKIC